MNVTIKKKLLILIFCQSFLETRNKHYFLFSYSFCFFSEITQWTHTICLFSCCPVLMRHHVLVEIKTFKTDEKESRKISKNKNLHLSDWLDQQPGVCLACWYADIQVPVSRRSPLHSERAVCATSWAKQKRREKDRQEVSF